MQNLDEVMHFKGYTLLLEANCKTFRDLSYAKPHSNLKSEGFTQSANKLPFRPNLPYECKGDDLKAYFDSLTEKQKATFLKEVARLQTFVSKNL
jgi:hypothetical protein